MSDKNTGWGSFLGNYFKNFSQKEKQPEKKISTNYNEFEKTFYKKQEVIAEEPQIPDAEYEKEVELAKQFLTENEEPVIETVTSDKSDTYSEPLPTEEFTQEEIEEFKRLNGIGDVKVKTEQKVVEQPTETKVKSVKVSKPKVEKEQKVEVKKEAKKETKKDTKPRTPRKPKK